MPEESVTTVDQTKTPKKKFSLKVVRLVAFALAMWLLGAGGGYLIATSGGVAKVLKNGSGSQNAVLLNRGSGPETIDFTLFWEVWDKLHGEYLDSDKLDNAKMVYGAISGMTAAIGDPYTVFLPPSDNKRAKEDLNGAFEGVGIQLGFIERQLAVISPLERHPAKAAGIKAGDLILRIKDEGKDIDVDTIGMSLPKAVEIIRGRKGTPVTLTVLHDGGTETDDISIVRDTIVVPSVEVELGNIANGKWQIAEDGRVAWLRLHRFGERTESQWNEAVSKILLAQSSKPAFAGVVLDLRNNPGGFLTGSVFVASEFINDGVIVKQQGKFQTQTYNVVRSGRLIGTPLTVLVNKGSASASEIVAGALRDRLAVKLVGETTFGKGTVQDAEDLRDGAGIHITTGRWLLPSGDWISDEGLTPDVEIAFEEEKTEKESQEEEISEEDTEDGDEGGREDRQLERAVEVLLQGS